MTYSDEEYRAAGIRMYGGEHVSVSQWASVQRVSGSGGAFVELTVWVPDDEAEAIRMEREFNRGRPVHPARI